MSHVKIQPSLIKKLYSIQKFFQTFFNNETWNGIRKQACNQNRGEINLTLDKVKRSQQLRRS